MGVNELDGVYVSGVPHYSPAGMRVWIVLCVSFTTTLSIIVVGLRILSRRIRKQPLWWDDYLIMFSMVWNWAVLGIGFAMFIEGTGYHAWELKPESVANISMWLLVTEIIYIWNLCWTKLSLLLMYYRIFHFSFFKKQVIVVGAFVVAWAVTITFLFTFICVPVQKLWHPEVEGHCVSELGVWLANASSTIFSDIVILLLPIPQVWKLQLRTLEKVGLTLVFGLGFFAVFSSSYRTWVLFNYSKSDIPYTLAPLLVWSDVEMCVGIISACLPTLRPVVNATAKKMGFKTIPFFTRASNHSKGVSTSGVSKDSRGHQRTPSANPDTLMRADTRSSHQSDGKPFYTMPDHGIDLEEILVETAEYGSDGRSKADSSRGKIFYAASSVEASIYNGDDVENDISMQRLQKKDMSQKK